MSLRVRGRALAQAAKASARVLPWGQLAGAAAVGMVFLVLLRPKGADSGPPVGALRMAALLLAAAAGLCLDDRSEPTVAASPTTRMARRAVRLGVGMAPTAAAWAVLVAVAVVLTPSHSLPVAALTLEAAGMAAVGLAMAALAVPWAPDGLGGVASGPALLALLLGSYVASLRWQVFNMLPVAPEDPAWMGAHVRWAMLLALSLVTVLACSVDPARQRLSVIRWPSALSSR